MKGKHKSVIMLLRVWQLRCCELVKTVWKASFSPTSWLLPSFMSPFPIGITAGSYPSLATLANRVDVDMELAKISMIRGLCLQ